MKAEKQMTAEFAPTPRFPRWGVRVSAGGRVFTHWFWWEGASATYALQAEALHGRVELVTRTQAEAEADVSEQLRPMLEEAQRKLDAAAAAAAAAARSKLELQLS